MIELGEQMVWRRKTEDKVAPALREEILKRDGGCIAPYLDPEASESCWGRITLDHVHLHAGGTKGKRAKSDRFHLVSLCQGHTEDGAKAGSQWNTAHREVLRRYLMRVNKIDCQAAGCDRLASTRRAITFNSAQVDTLGTLNYVLRLCEPCDEMFDLDQPTYQN